MGKYPSRAPYEGLRRFVETIVVITGRRHGRNGGGNKNEQKTIDYGGGGGNEYDDDDNPNATTDSVKKKDKRRSEYVNRTCSRRRPLARPSYRPPTRWHGPLYRRNTVRWGLLINAYGPCGYSVTEFQCGYRRQ